MNVTTSGTEAIIGNPSCDTPATHVGPERRAPVGGAQFGALTSMDYTDIPDEARGFCWAAFLMPLIWSIGNRTWVGLLALVPMLQLPIGIWLGFKGREMAWKNCEWQDADHFNRVQLRWTQAALTLTGLFLSGLLISYINDPVATAKFLSENF